MNTNITQKNLIQFLYGELSPAMHLEIMHQLDINNDLRKEYELLRKDVSLLNTINESPSKTSVRILLEKASESSSLEGIV